MRRKQLSLQVALEMEKNDLLTLYYIVDPASQGLIELPYPFERWYRNYIEAGLEYNKVPQTSLLEFLNTRYVTEIRLDKDEELNRYGWTYVYGQLTTDKERLERYYSKGRYVYVLTNTEAPQLVKIGKAVNPEQRLKQINGAGVLIEWDLHYAIPVEDDYLVEGLVHKELQKYRVSSNKGSSREIFEIDLDTAIKTIESFGDLYRTGESIYY